MPTKKLTKKTPMKNLSFFEKLDWKPLIVNPIVVFAYAAIAVLLLDDTQIGDADTWVKAGLAGLLALLSFIKNSLVETRRAIKA